MPTWVMLIVLVAMMANLPLDAEDVFVSSTLRAGEPYAVTRIPALARTGQGTLLAFAEGRRSISDQSSNVILLRRRELDRHDWSPIQVVVQDEPASLNNPCVLVAGRTVWLMVQRYPDGLNERTTSTGFDLETSCRTWVTFSRDDGLTWSTPRDVTVDVKSDKVQSSASGPGIGIQLKRGQHKGRLLFPFNEGNSGAYDVLAVISDDHGKTWRRGSVAPKQVGTQPNEVQFAELSDGTILLNARNQASGRFRLASRSRDGGETWETCQPVPELPDPVCMGSLLRLAERPNVLLFSNPADTRRRAKGTIRASYDDGRSWSIVATVESKSFEYSSLCGLGGARFGILYESREHSAEGREGYRIRYAEFGLEPLHD